LLDPNDERIFHESFIWDPNSCPSDELQSLRQAHQLEEVGEYRLIKHLEILAPDYDALLSEIEALPEYQEEVTAIIDHWTNVYDESIACGDCADCPTESPLERLEALERETCRDHYLRLSAAADAAGIALEDHPE
jgi:hypothetical protein